MENLVTPQAIAEWNAWRAMANFFTEIGIDFNNDDEIAKAIAVWGYRYERLRASQEINEPPIFYDPEFEDKLLTEYVKEQNDDR
jgi:hypothetical protein